MRKLVKNALMVGDDFVGCRYSAYDGEKYKGSVDVSSTLLGIVNTDIMDGIPLVTEGDIQMFLSEDGENFITEWDESRVVEIDKDDEWVDFIRNVLQGNDEY